MEAAVEAACNFLQDNRPELLQHMPIRGVVDIVHHYTYSERQFEDTIYCFTRSIVSNRHLDEFCLYIMHRPVIGQWLNKALGFLRVHLPLWKIAAGSEAYASDDVAMLSHALKLDSYAICSRLWCFYLGDRWGKQCQCGSPII